MNAPLPANDTASSNAGERPATWNVVRERGYMTSITREHGFEPMRVEGRLPEGLKGTLYRVGPGLFETQGHPYDHPFEGDGAVCAVRLDGQGGAQGAHRILETAGLMEERAAGRPLYGSAATWPRRLANGLRLRAKNAANTNLVHWQGRLFALWEAGPPTEITGELETLGTTDLGGVIPMTFSAHPHRVASRDTVYNFGIEYGYEPHLNLFELGPEGPAKRVVRLPFDNLMLHDFAVSERHAVFLVAPTQIAMLRSLFGLKPFERLIRWAPKEGTEVIVVPLDDPDAHTRFRVDAFYQWHFAGAFERGGELFVDAITYPDFGSFEELSTGTVSDPGHLTRLRVDVAGRRLHHESLSDVACEFPRIDPRREGSDYAGCWVLSSFGDREGIVFVGPDGEKRHAFDEGQHASEPVFIPRAPEAPEGDGWLLSLVYDTRTHLSHVAVLDSQSLGEEPVARLWFDHHVPMTFHGIWVG